MRNLKIAIGVIAITAILMLPVTCICQLMEVDGLFAMPPHLLIFAAHHNPDAQAVTSVPMSDQSGMMDMGQILVAGMFDPPATMNPTPHSARMILIPSGGSMSQHGDLLTDFNPILVATLPAPGLLAQVIPAAYYLMGNQPASPQYSPAPPTPPPPLV